MTHEIDVDHNTWKAMSLIKSPFSLTLPADKGFELGDEIVLRETLGKEQTGRELIKKISRLSKHGTHCVMEVV